MTFQSPDPGLGLELVISMLTANMSHAQGVSSVMLTEHAPVAEAAHSFGKNKTFYST